MIQVDAYKKWVLVHLLANGQVHSETHPPSNAWLTRDEKVPAMPRTTNVHGAKIISALSKAYEALGQIFHEGIFTECSADRLTAEVEAGRDIWRDVSSSLQEHWSCLWINLIYLG